MSFLTWDGSRSSASGAAGRVVAKRKGKAQPAASASGPSAKPAPIDEYKRVPPEEVPHQSFKGYQMCANLEVRKGEGQTDGAAADGEAHGPGVGSVSACSAVYARSPLAGLLSLALPMHVCLLV